MYACVYLLLGTAVYTHTHACTRARCTAKLGKFSTVLEYLWQKEKYLLLLLCSNNHTRLENFTMSVKLISKYPLQYKKCMHFAI